MPNILAAFPRRDVRLRPPRLGLRAWTLAILGTLLFGFGLTMLVTEVVPGLQQDLALRGVAEPLRGGRLVEGHCRTQMAVFAYCDIKLAYAPKGETVHQKDMHYVFVDAHFGDYSAEVMGDPGDTSKLTTDLGMERLTNRVITGSVLALALVALIVTAIGSAVRASSAYGGVRRAFAGKTLQPVVVGVAPGGSQVWRLNHEGKVIDWPVPKRTAPFLVAPGQALAVTVPGGPVFPLDEKLRWIDLTEAERQGLLAARGA